jgi:hypothetical protein
VEGKAAVLQLRWASTALSLRLEVP